MNLNVIYLIANARDSTFLCGSLLISVALRVTYLAAKSKIFTKIGKRKAAPIGDGL